jgi:hypothetical protein
MEKSQQSAGLTEAFDAIEDSILRSLSMMLDTLLEASTLAQPGIDAETYAAELRTLALQLESVTRQVEALSPVQAEALAYRAA